MNKHRNHGAEFKARVALKAVKGERTVSELAAEYGLQPRDLLALQRVPRVHGLLVIDQPATHADKDRRTRHNLPAGQGGRHRRDGPSHPPTSSAAARRVTTSPTQTERKPQDRPFRRAVKRSRQARMLRVHRPLCSNFGRLHDHIRRPARKTLVQLVQSCCQNASHLRDVGTKRRGQRRYKSHRFRAKQMAWELSAINQRGIHRIFLGLYIPW
jgi:hypothetical protein